jgi:hypothetical protein
MNAFYIGLPVYLFDTKMHEWVEKVCKGKKKNGDSERSLKRFEQAAFIFLVPLTL